MARDSLMSHMIYLVTPLERCMLQIEKIIAYKSSQLAEGKFLRMFGRHGGGRGELFCPISITLDTSDIVYVGNYDHRVSVFTSDGHFITSFGKKGVGPGEFDYPYGLAVDASGVVYVCDRGNNRIQAF